MKIGKDTLATARRLFRLCLEGPDHVLSEDRVREVAEQITAAKPRRYAELLEAFYLFVRQAVQTHTAIVRSAVPLTDEERNKILQKLEARHGKGLYFRWETDPSLIGGLRIQVGDDVIDGSVRSRIDRLNDLKDILSE